MDYKKIKEEFNSNIEKEDGHKILVKVTEIINDLGSRFLDMNGGDLAEYQAKLAGFKFYLADYVADINMKYEALKLEIKSVKASSWDIITDEIRSKEGKVKNKEQIENKIFSKTEEMQIYQMLYEALYYKYKIKISSIDSMLTAITQRLAELKKQLDQQV